MSFGERLADLRKDKGLKQKQLALELGISEDMLSSYERGKYTVPDDIKVKIAEYFDISLDYLFGLVDAQISYRRSDVYVLPKNFPRESYGKLVEYANLLINQK